jgi:hypothetical protein
MPAIKGSHIALLVSGTCALLTGAIFLVDTSGGPSKHQGTNSRGASGEEVPNLHAASNHQAPRRLQASLTEDGMGGTVIRLPQIDIVANETDSPLADEHGTVTFVCESTDATVAAKQ